MCNSFTVVSPGFTAYREEHRSITAAFLGTRGVPPTSSYFCVFGGFSNL